MTKQQQVQAMRTRAKAIRLDIKRLRLDHLHLMLEIRTLQGNEHACARITSDLHNFLNPERAKARKARGKS